MLWWWCKRKKKSLSPVKLINSQQTCFQVGELALEWEAVPGRQEPGTAARWQQPFTSAGLRLAQEAAGFNSRRIWCSSKWATLITPTTAKALKAAAVTANDGSIHKHEKKAILAFKAQHNEGCGFLRECSWTDTLWWCWWNHISRQGLSVAREAVFSSTAISDPFITPYQGECLSSKGFSNIT